MTEYGFGLPRWEFRFWFSFYSCFICLYIFIYFLSYYTPLFDSYAADVPNVMFLQIKASCCYYNFPYYISLVIIFFSTFYDCYVICHDFHISAYLKNIVKFLICPAWFFFLFISSQLLYYAAYAYIFTYFSDVRKLTDNSFSSILLHYLFTKESKRSF